MSSSYTFKIEPLLSSYYNDIVNEYDSLSPIYIQSIMAKYFDIENINQSIHSANFATIVSQQCIPQSWMTGIALMIYFYPTEIEIYLASVVYLPDYVSDLIKDQSFRELALIAIHITRII